ncbi:MAG: hypothetical protein CSA81_08200 [Acidobacteria bacterium]|nr:MAG: hypothetical protein CSA81_08200 [Acidobacteriota bacterium]
MKLTTLMTCILAIACTLKANETPPYEKDVRVLETVFTTMLGVENRHPFFGYPKKPVNATYLKKQGLLIEINTRQLAKVPFPPAFFPRLSRVNFEIPPFKFQDKLDDEFEVEEFRALEALHDAEAEAIFEISELDSEEEWIAEERDYLERELQEKFEQAEKMKVRERARLAEEMKKIKEMAQNKKLEMEQLKAELMKFKETRLRILKKYRDQLSEIKREHKENWSKTAEKIRHTLVDALCQYGATIRAVQGDEYYTAILRGFEYNDEGNRVDRIYIFPKRDILACRDGKITNEELLASAETYLSY